jgi:hypothetical protein
MFAAATATVAASRPASRHSSFRATTTATSASASCRPAPCLVSSEKHFVKAAKGSGRGAVQRRRALGEGNPFVEGWMDLAAVVSGGGKDLGIGELAENLGSDVYLDINGWRGGVHGGGV